VREDIEEGAEEEDAMEVMARQQQRSTGGGMPQQKVTYSLNFP